MDPYSHRKVQPIKQRRNKRKPLSVEIQSMYKILSITVFILGSVSTIAYLSLNASKSAKGYNLLDLQATYNDLQSESNKINHQLLEAQSMGVVQEEIPNEMLENTESTYLEGDNGYALN